MFYDNKRQAFCQDRSKEDFSRELTAFKFKVECGAIYPQVCSRAKLALANAGKRIASKVLIYNPINVNVTFIETNTMCKSAFDGKYKCPCKQTSPFGNIGFVRMGNLL